MATVSSAAIGVMSHRHHDDRTLLPLDIAATTNLTTHAKHRSTHTQNASIDSKKKVPGTEYAHAAQTAARATATAEGQPGGRRQNATDSPGASFTVSS